VRDIAFDAVQSLWRRRQAEGMTQAQLAETIGKDAGWVSRNLRGPGNWTARTVGAFVVGLNGEIEITVHALEDPLPIRSNYHAYSGYEVPLPLPTSQTSQATLLIEPKVHVASRSSA
jgi:hypothetical protein